MSAYFCDWPSLHASLPLSAMQDRLGVKGQMEEDIVEEEEVEVRTTIGNLALFTDLLSLLHSQ